MEYPMLALGVGIAIYYVLKNRNETEEQKARRLAEEKHHRSGRRVSAYTKWLQLSDVIFRPDGMSPIYNIVNTMDTADGNMRTDLGALGGRAITGMVH